MRAEEERDSEASSEADGRVDHAIALATASSSPTTCFTTDCDVRQLLTIA
jgi:hypothetical protein